MEETSGNFHSAEILAGLENIIAKKVRSRETRASINAMSFMPEQVKPIAFRDYGLEGYLQNQELQSVEVGNAIDECNQSIEKLLLISDYLGHISNEIIKTLLSNNTFDNLSLSEIQVILSKPT